MKFFGLGMCGNLIFLLIVVFFFKMENGFTSQTLSHPALVLASLPEALRMQLGPFNPQVSSDNLRPRDVW